MANESLVNVLNKYLPAESVQLCTDWIVKLNIHLTITENRFSKYGDYRPDRSAKAHLITINHNLNKYAFLITFIHEVAHLAVEKKYGVWNVMSHGSEWKAEYSSLLKYFLAKDIFPHDISKALLHYIHSPTSKSCNNAELMRVLKKHDTDGSIHVEQLPEGAVFKLFNEQSKLIFKKGKKARTRFHCVEVTTGRKFLVSGIADAVQLSNFAQ